MDSACPCGSEEYLAEELNFKKWQDSIRLSFVENMKLLGGNVNNLFDIESGKILTEHISGEHQCLNSEERNLTFLWSCFVARDDLLEPLYRMGVDLLTTLLNEGFTALHLAAFSGSTTSCKWLILNGLKLNILVKNLSPLHCAVIRNSLACTKLLLGHGATLGSTVLHCSVKANATECLQHLLNVNAKMNAVDEDGLTALHVAADRGMVKCLQVLISHRPKADLDIQTRRKRSTPLHLASRNGYFECCQLLINGGADVDAVDHQELTALHLAVQNQSTDCLETLLDARCNVNAQDRNGSTALHKALSGPNVSFNAFKVLFKRGADVNIGNRVGYTALHLAAKAQRTDCINILLDAGCNVNAQTVSGRTPLHVTLSGTKPGPNVLEALLKRGADVNLSDRHGRTPLHLAAEANSTECLQILLDAGCNVNAQDVYGSTPLHEALSGHKLTFNALEVLLKRGADVNIRDKLGYTALHLAAKNQTAACLEILLESGCNVNAKATNGQTPLHVALSRPELAFDALEVLIKRGAEVNESDIHGTTPLHLAANDQSINCLKLLLNAGCDINAQDEDGSTPLHKALSGPELAVDALKFLLNKGADVNVSARYGYSPLHLAVEAESTQCVEMLVDAGCNIDALTTSWRTPLHLALCKSKLAFNIVEVLLKKGAQVNVSDIDGKTPMHLAAKAQSTKCLELLLDAGCSVNVQDENGSTPLHNALSGPEPVIHVVKVLLERGASVNISDRYGYTPLHLAAEAASADCVERLLDAGCNVNAPTESGSTPLHLALFNPNWASNTLEVLLSRGADVNLSDSHGSTPLHLAVKAQSTKCLKIILDAGCNVNAQDRYGSTPLHKALSEPEVSSDVLEALLERAADVNVSDWLGYTPLHLGALHDIPFNGISQSVNRLIMSGADVTARTYDGLSALKIIRQNTPCSINTICRKLDSSISIIDQEASNKEVEVMLDFNYLLPKTSAGEVAFLNTLQVEGCDYLTEHPLWKAFLHLKWQKIRKFYFFHLFFSFVFVILLTMYVISFVLAHECYNVANGNSTAREMCLNSTIIGSFFIQQPELVESIWHWLRLLAIFKTIRKILSISGHTSIKDYFYQLTNFFEWFVILSVYLVPCTWFRQTFDWKKSVGGLAALLAWADFMILVGQLPVFGIYVEMYTRVQTEFFKLLFAYSCLLIGFTASFCVFFPRNDTFQNPLIGFIKILAMMTGELDFGMLKSNLSNKTTLLIVIVYITYALLLLFVTAVLMNLLVGIAVNDIQGLHKTASLSKLVRRTQLIYFLELALSRNLPEKMVNFLLSLVSLEAPVLRVKPFHPYEKQFPRGVLMDAFILAKQKKTRTNSVSIWSPGLKHCPNSISYQDEKNSNDETRTRWQLQDTVSKLTNNKCNNLSENRFIEHEKKLYEELRQLKETVSKLVNAEQ